MQGPHSELSLLIGKPMSLKKQGHLHCQEEKVSGIPAYWGCWEEQTSERGRSGRPKSVLFCSDAITPTQESQPFPWLQVSPMSRWPPYSVPWSTLQNYETKFLLDIFIWLSHRNITLDMFEDILTIPLKLLLPLHFLYKWMTFQSTQSSQKKSFIHSFIDLKKYLFNSILDNVCLLSI